MEDNIQFIFTCSMSSEYQ